MSAARACVDKTGHACNLCAPAAAINVKFVTPSGEEIVVKAQDGDSILDVALEHDIDIEGSYPWPRPWWWPWPALCSAVVTVWRPGALPSTGACGGECACSTCHVILEQDVFDSLEEPDEEEEDMLDLALGLTDTFVMQSLTVQNCAACGADADMWFPLPQVTPGLPSHP